MPNPKEEKVVSRDGKLEGVATGKVRRCGLEGCTGIRIMTKWPGGKITYPCSKGMKRLRSGWRII